MQRWHVTLICGAAAVVVAAVVEDLAPVSTPTSTAIAPPSIVKALSASTDVVRGAGFDARVALDQSALLANTPEERLVVVTLDGHASDGPELPVNVSVVLDASGSMGAEGKMDYAKRAVGELLLAMDDDDHVSVVTFADRAEVVLENSPVLDPERLVRHVLAVSEGGGTNLHAGLSEGFSQARRASDGEAVDRIVLLSDGRANLGITDPDELSSLVSAWTERGFSVSTLGLGLDFNEDLLASLADRGAGSYHFVDDPSELQALFQDELHRAQALAAGAVAVTLVPAPGVEIVEVLGYESAPRGGGERVLVGDLHASQSRKVVARVRIDPSTVGSRDVLSVQISQRDAPSTALELDARVHDDAAVVAASVNVEIAALAAEAEAAVLSQQATMAFERGDTQRMRRLVTQSLERASSAASAYDNAKLRAMESSLEERFSTMEVAKPGSAEALYQVKRAKEADRNAAY